MWETVCGRDGEISGDSVLRTPGWCEVGKGPPSRGQTLPTTRAFHAIHESPGVMEGPGGYPE